MSISDKNAENEVQEAKAKLEALFGGSSSSADSAPGGKAIARRSRTPTGKVFANARKSTGRAPTEYRLRLERLRSARGEELKEAVDTFLAHHQLPDEVDILYKVLQHPSEEVIRNALGQLSSLLMQGRLNATMLLQDHLNSLKTWVKDPATHSYIEGLTSQLQSLEK